MCTLAKNDPGGGYVPINSLEYSEAARPTWAKPIGRC
jgi:hypothetical protein